MWDALLLKIFDGFERADPVGHWEDQNFGGVGEQFHYDWLMVKAAAFE